jgi:hypothetical protein
MLGQWVWSIVLVLVVAFLLSETFPGKRGAPVASAVATMQWTASARATPLSFDQVTDLATCREMQRQIAQQRDVSDTGITLACRPSGSRSAL